MDEDLLAALCVFLALLCAPVLVVFTICFSVAYSRTKTWQKAKAQHLADQGESSASASLLKPHTVDDTDADSDLSDSEVEDARAEAAEATQDFELTTRQKLRKELKRALKGEVAAEQTKKAERENRKKEREERKKLARQVARELVRMKRRGEVEDVLSLPAVSLSGRREKA